MGFFRNVGKMSSAIYGVGKKAIQFKRLVGKATGGASDKLINYGVNALERQLREKLPRYDQLKEVFNTGHEMVNDVRGGDCEGALKKGHQFAKQHSSRYNDLYNQVNERMDQYNLRQPAYQMYNNNVRPYMRNSNYG